jgi:hypothetical protein
MPDQHLRMAMVPFGSHAAAGSAAPLTAAALFMDFNQTRP